MPLTITSGLNENGIEKIKVDFGFGRQPKVGFAAGVPYNFIERHVAMEGAELRCVDGDFKLLLELP